MSNYNLSPEQRALAYPDLRVSPHFPLVKPECKDQAIKFFACLSDASEITTERDDDAAKRGLRSCYLHMVPYDKCMVEALEAQEKRLAAGNK